MIVSDPKFYDLFENLYLNFLNFHKKYTWNIFPVTSTNSNLTSMESWWFLLFLRNKLKCWKEKKRNIKLNQIIKCQMIEKNGWISFYFWSCITFRRLQSLSVTLFIWLQMDIVSLANDSHLEQCFKIRHWKNKSLSC